MTIHFPGDDCQSEDIATVRSAYIDDLLRSRAIDRQRIRTLEDALAKRRRMVLSAPTLTYGERDAKLSVPPHGFPPIADPIHDGSISNTYALRDAILFWMDKQDTELAEVGVPLPQNPGEPK